MSFDFHIDEKEAETGELIDEFGKQLQCLFLNRKAAEGLTQQELAERLGVDRSRVNRCLSGHANLTLTTLSELSHGMRGKVLVKIIPEEDARNWKFVWSNPQNSRASTVNVARVGSGVEAEAEPVHRPAIGNWS